MAGSRQACILPNHRMRLRAIKSYTASRKPAGINRNTAVSENGNPSRLNIRRTAEERISTRPASTTMIEPIPPSGRPACRENAVPDSDCLAVNRKTSLRSKWSKKSTQRLQNAHSPSKTTTACRVECTSLLSQAESLHPFERSALSSIIGSYSGPAEWEGGAVPRRQSHSGAIHRLRQRKGGSPVKLGTRRN